MLTTIEDFCRKYGPEAFGHLIVTPEKPRKKQAETALLLKVTPACISRWETKFCDEYLVLKDKVLDILESQYRIEIENLEGLRKLVEDQQAILKFLKGGRYGTRSANQDLSA